MEASLTTSELSINSIPENALLFIFKRLTLDDLCLAVRQTCTYWLELSYDYSLWQQLDLSGKCDTLTDVALSDAVKRIGVNVKEISVRGCTLLTDLSAFNGLAQCRNLKRVDICSTHFTNTGLNTIVTGHPALEYVQCNRCPFITHAYLILRKLHWLKQFSDPYEDCLEQPEDCNEGIQNIAHSSPNITQLRISSNVFDDEVLVTICRKFHGNLRILEIPNCVWITGEGLVASATLLTKLTHLDISGTSISDAELTLFVQTCTQLLSINLSKCRKVTDAGIMQVVKACRQIQRLLLNESTAYSGNVTDAGMASIALYSNDLEELKICFCPSVTDAGVQCVAEGCHNLKSLYITGCPGLSDAAVIAVANNCSTLERLTASQVVHLTSMSINRLLSQCRSLQCLQLETSDSLTGISFTNNDPSDVHLHKALLENNLETEDASSFRLVDSDPESSCPTPLKTITDSTSQYGANLIIIDLSFCFQMDDGSIDQIAKHCPQLRYISVRGCYLLSDAAIETVARRCSLLQVLDISGNSSMSSSSLTDSSVISIASYCRRLVMLNLTKNPRITIGGVMLAVHACCSLKRLGITASESGDLLEILRLTKEDRSMSCLQDFNLKYVTAETMGDFLLKFPSKRISTT